MIAIYNTDGDLQCKYNYDAWGNHRIYDGSALIYDSATGVIATGYESHIAIQNPIRYRGYYYDTETGLYYLQSRYYDATLCRFLNRDNVNYLEPESIHGINLYAYCNNNPIMFADPSGHFAIIPFLIGLGISTLIGAIVGGVSYVASEVLSYAITGEWSWSWSSFVGSVLGGAIGGILAAIPGVNAMAVAYVSGFASTAIGMGLENAWEGKNYTFCQIMLVSKINGLISLAAGRLFEFIPIKGINSGRGSYSAITKQITTKFFNGTIKRISYKTFLKMLTYNMLGSMIGAGASGVIDATAANNSMTN